MYAYPENHLFSNFRRRKPGQARLIFFVGFFFLEGLTLALAALLVSVPVVGVGQGGDPDRRRTPVTLLGRLSGWRKLSSGTMSSSRTPQPF